MEHCVRLTEISIKNFKNVVNGEVSLVNNRKNFKSSILGLYGQNGSGKTALIDVLELLKNVLCETEVPDRFADYINVDSETSEIEYSFDVTLGEQVHPVTYRLVLEREVVSDTDDMENVIEERFRYHVKISSELLRCQMRAASGKMRMGKVIDTGADTVFAPKAKYELLTGGSRETDTDLLVAKKLSQKTARSFVFSKDLMNVIQNRAADKSSSPGAEDAAHYMNLIMSLVRFGRYELFVINTANSGLISLNAQPLMFRIQERKKGTAGTIAIPIEKPSVVPEDLFHVTETVIENMNIVLEAIIPGLTMAVKDLGSQLMPNGTAGKRIELVSKKNSREIPLKYESEGIKKIVSILQLLVVVYNQKSITVAIDELDSGVFEYLLGELLRIISEKGKGQLIFTSHNLRPLETIDKGFVAFTTTNPENRYIRLTNVKENNNLRDFYYRDIMLGGQAEEVYDLTNNAEISMAFREAGERIGS